jgi:hypothetical protein
VGAHVGGADQLDLQVEPVGHLDDALHLESIKADEAASVFLHPLFLLAAQFMTTRSLVRAAEVSCALNPLAARPAFQRARSDAQRIPPTDSITGFLRPARLAG